MESVWIYLLIAIGVLVVGAGLIVGLVRGRKHAPAKPVVARPAATAVDQLSDEPVVEAPDAFSEILDVAIPPAPIVEQVAVVEDIDAAVLDVPEPARGRLGRLRARLSRSNNALGKGLLALLSRDSLDAATWDEIEETLLIADLGVSATAELLERLKTRVRVDSVRDAATIEALLREELLALVDPSMDRSLATARHADRPAVVLVVGVNGTGKTTTVGKLARLLVAEDRTVVLGAADTFRAAAAQQLQTWGDRVGAAVVTGPEGGDPASVAFEAVAVGVAAEVDTVVIDTAGRLHTKVGLMDELGKVKRVAEKHGPVDEVLLVLDATTGQNGLMQARVFSEVVDVTGIVLTKLDGTAKGGIVVSVQRELGVPVKLVGLGEGPDDLAPFDPVAFVDAIIGS
ncbi:MAG: signal recognition particle-docking protein FtsY [Actinobacteria bacterium]|nr:signal recognition particle-docking protein FtsY [Actinomycetota bacterium]